MNAADSRACSAFLKKLSSCKRKAPFSFQFRRPLIVARVRGRGTGIELASIALSDEVIVTLGERVELRLKLVFGEARELEVVAAHDARLDVRRL